MTTGLSIAIPTYNRGPVLCETITMLLPLGPREILIIDQTPAHAPEIEARLQSLETSGAIRWIRLERPSITGAMNTALREASGEFVLFLDDDIVPSNMLLQAHERVLEDETVWASTGQVLQPGETPRHYQDEELRRGPIRDLEFRFHHDAPCDVQNVMAGNLAVSRARACQIGGFDENFADVAYRFETDFALRLAAAGGRIRYEPAASIHHLKAPAGGVRAWGDHRSSASPAHSSGDYYFASQHVPRFWIYVVRRLVKNVATRYHLKHPWAIPSKIIGELRGLISGLRRAREGRRLGIVVH